MACRHVRGDAGNRICQLLALHQLDPTERLSEFDKRSRAEQLLQASLNHALKSSENFFIENPHSLADAMLRPRDAALWLLRMPKRRELVPPGLRAFLEPPVIEAVHVATAPEVGNPEFAAPPLRGRPKGTDPVRQKAIAALKEGRPMPPEVSKSTAKRARRVVRKS